MLTYREILIEDYNEIYNLWQRTEGIGLSSADSREGISKYLQHNPGLCFLCEKGEKVIATILAGSDGRRGYIHHLAVDKDYRNKGIAKKLLEMSLNKLKEQGIEKAHLFVLEENETGKSFWEKVGWEQRNDICSFSKNLIDRKHN